MLGDVLEEGHEALAEAQASVLGRHGDGGYVAVPVRAAPLGLAQD